MVYNEVYGKAYGWLSAGRAKRRSIAAWAGVWAAYHSIHGFTANNPLVAWQLACALGATARMRVWGQGLIADCRDGSAMAARWRRSNAFFNPDASRDAN